MKVLSNKLNLNLSSIPRVWTSKHTSGPCFYIPKGSRRPAILSEGKDSRACEIPLNSYLMIRSNLDLEDGGNPSNRPPYNYNAVSRFYRYVQASPDTVSPLSTQGQFIPAYPSLEELAQMDYVRSNHIFTIFEKVDMNEPDAGMTVTERLMAACYRKLLGYSGLNVNAIIADLVNRSRQVIRHNVYNLQVVIGLRNFHNGYLLRGLQIHDWDRGLEFIIVHEGNGNFSVTPRTHLALDYSTDFFIQNPEQIKMWEERPELKDKDQVHYIFKDNVVGVLSLSPYHINLDISAEFKGASIKQILDSVLKTDINVLNATPDELTADVPEFYMVPASNRCWNGESWSNYPIEFLTEELSTVIGTINHSYEKDNDVLDEVADKLRLTEFDTDDKRSTRDTIIDAGVDMVSNYTMGSPFNGDGHIMAILGFAVDIPDNLKELVDRELQAAKAQLARIDNLCNLEAADFVAA